ncbi:MAG TPA: hypothetical protein VNE82_03030 [Candidatus Binataceae bacterium]|nr:hypothetical protein [Candidatus Binataceae bacterium]
MIEPSEPTDFAAARDQLDLLCAKVGLTRSDALPPANATGPAPSGAALWSSDYARLLLWPCPGSDAASVEAAARTGQAWFDEVLVQGEHRTGGRPLDGYLVLALPSTPGFEAREDVRRLELSAQVCRKHLIWPSAPDDAEDEIGRWQRVADVTVLGLPDVDAAPGAELEWPAIDAQAQALWDDLNSMGVPATVIQDEEA